MTELQRWHRAAIRPSPPEPEPVTPTRWKAWPQERRDEHVSAVRTWLGSLYLDNAAARDAVAVMDRVVDTNQYTAPGAKQIAALTGPYTVGKSTVVNRWARARHRAWVGAEACARDAAPSWSPEPGLTANHVPVVRINLQSGARIKEFDAQVLSFLGYPTSGVARSMTERLLRAVVMHSVRLLVVDDVHLLKTNWKGGREVLDHLKHINTELGEQHASMVLVGADLEQSAITADPQIAGRLAPLCELGPCAVGTVEEQQAWQDLLAGLEEPLLRHLPHTCPDLLQVKTAGLLWRRTQGFLGELAMLVHGAAELAFRDGSLAIGPPHLAGAPVSRRAEQARAALERRRRQTAVPA